MKLEKIDIKAGKMTFGQRIELGKIFQGEGSDVEKFNQTFKCLHGFQPKVKEFKELIAYFHEILEGIRFWIEQEGHLLKYEPTAEELSAGIRQLSARIGEFGTIKALAKTYGRDPDEILQWEYSKVFGILYTDLEEHKYQKRFNKLTEKKYKT